MTDKGFFHKQALKVFHQDHMKIHSLSLSSGRWTGDQAENKFSEGKGIRR